MRLEEPGELSNLVVGVEVLQDFTSDCLPGLESSQGYASQTSNATCSARHGGLTMVELPAVPKAAKCRQRSCQGSEQQAEDFAEGQGLHDCVASAHPRVEKLERRIVDISCAVVSSQDV